MFLSLLQNLEIFGTPINIWRPIKTDDLDIIMNAKWDLNFTDFRDETTQPTIDNYQMNCYRNKLISRINCDLIYQNQTYTHLQLQMRGEFREIVDLTLEIQKFSDLHTTLHFDKGKIATGNVPSFDLNYVAKIYSSQRGDINLSQGTHYMFVEFKRIDDIEDKINPLYFIPVVGIFLVIGYMVFSSSNEQDKIVNKNKDE